MRQNAALPGSSGTVSGTRRQQFADRGAARFVAASAGDVEFNMCASAQSATCLTVILTQSEY